SDYRGCRFSPRCGTCRGFGNLREWLRKWLKKKGDAKRPRASIERPRTQLAFLLDCRLSRQEADLGMCPIAEGFVRGCAAAAQRNRLFPAEIDFVPLRISNFKLAQVSADHIRPGFFDQDVHWHLVFSSIKIQR